jgi:predicted ester cyclase
MIEEIWNKGNFEVAGELIHPEAVMRYDRITAVDSHGPQGLQETVTQFRAAFPDLNLTIEDTVAHGDRVATRWTATGTHQGELLGLAPTGEPVAITGMTIDRFRGAKIIEAWSNWDTLDLMQQIGAAPAPGSVGERLGKGVQRLTARRMRRRQTAPS